MPVIKLGKWSLPVNTKEVGEVGDQKLSDILGDNLRPNILSP